MSLPNLDIDRRAFLQGLAGLGALSLLPPSASLAASQPQWRNWSGNQTASPNQMLYPRNADGLAELLKTTTGVVRPLGGSHSFSALVPTDDTIISLEAMAGLQHFNAETLEARFGGGTRLAMASQQAWDAGGSFINEPDINLQSLSGAIATATHGTGLGLPSMSGMVSALTVMTPDGESHHLNADDERLLAAGTHLGALGFITDITFKLQPSYRLEERIWTMSLDDAMAYIEQEKHNHRHIELFAFPRGNTAIVQTVNPTDKPDTESEKDDSNELLERVSQLAMRAGWLTPNLQRLVTLFVSESVYRGPAHKVFANRRAVRFNEMEYTVPAEDGIRCLREVCERIREQKINVFFPIEFRYTAAESPWLSMFHDRPGASLSVHQYYQQDKWPLFNAVEPIMQRYQGRPHWGKIHTMDARQLRQVYPRFDDFLAVRQAMDPKGRMLNAHLKQLFGDAV